MQLVQDVSQYFALDQAKIARLVESKKYHRSTIDKEVPLFGDENGDAESFLRDSDYEIDGTVFDAYHFLPSSALGWLRFDGERSKLPRNRTPSISN